MRRWTGDEPTLNVTTTFMQGFWTGMAISSILWLFTIAILLRLMS